MARLCLDFRGSQDIAQGISKSIEPGYEPTTFGLTNGKTLSGLEFRGFQRTGTHHGIYGRKGLLVAIGSVNNLVC